ncbi:putative U3 small nucleolar RNA-associated protein 11-like [Capsicum annuum]|nr:putative U3 small nucleolar RNA-associated protein 11-like [Capsicum annuum]
MIAKNSKNLPRDIWRLVSLRCFVCRRCHSLTHIPRGLWQLKSLMHLDLDGCSSLEDMPPGIGQLTSLQTLTSFIIGKESCTSGQASDKLNELKGLVDIRNSLSIKFMGRVRAIVERTPTGVVKRFDYFVHEDRANQFYLEIRKYYPGLKDGSLEPGYAGIRPKLFGPEEGSTDFVVQGVETHGISSLVNLFGIESPGLSFSMAITEHIAG